MSLSAVFVLCCLLLYSAVSSDAVKATAALRLNNLFSSNMVLQRAPQQAAMWGYGEQGRTVTVALDGKAVAASKVDASGNWSVQLPATEASTDHTITASDGTSNVTLLNVAFGDVYLCSGQSNMMIVLNYSFGGPELTASASSYPNLRLFNVYMQNDTVPRNESGVSFSPDSWVLPSADTLQYTGNWQDVWDYFSAVCYWTGVHLYDSLNGTVPLGLVHSSWGGTCIQAWTSADTNDKCGPLITPPFIDSQNEPSVLYNAMIHPLTPMRLAAVLWYQGESDDFDADRYGCSFPNMITDWRSKFGYPELPFYYALLAPFTQDDTFVTLRESQMQALQLNHVGVANTIDLGDMDGWMGEVHPRNKSYVGQRFARWLLRDVYHQQVEVDGPEQPNVDMTSAQLVADTLVVTVQYSADARNDGLFALATPDCVNATRYGCCMAVSSATVSAGLLELTYPYMGSTVMTSAAVTINVTGSTRTLTMTIDSKLPKGGATVQVAHAWQPFPGCALYNDHQLPALPFRVNVTVRSGLSDPLAAPFRLNNLFSNHMVLQRAPQQAVVWGYGEPGSTVTVQVDNAPALSTSISSSGDWSVQLPATPASFNHTITASDGSTSVTLSDVAFGDVYLCSVQSNMEIMLRYSFGGPGAIAAASQYSNIRLFNIRASFNDTPLNESAAVSYSPDSWVLPSSSTLQNDINVWNYFSGTCYWTGKHISDSLNGSLPIGLVHSSFGGTIVVAWTSPDTNTKCGPINLPPIFPNNNPSALYNAMIHPLLPMRLTAVLWYQGESDFYDVDRYKCSFPNMIADWRSKFGYPELPFYFVLLSPYTGFDDQLPPLRLAQLHAWPATNVGVASAIDLGDMHGSEGNIHPRNKSYVGERLARWVRRDIYGQQVCPVGPEPLSDANSVRVTAKETGHNITEVTVLLTYPMTDVSSGLFMLPSPDCTACCQQGGGVLLVSFNGTSIAYPDPNGPYVLQFRPPVSIDQQAHTLSATYNMPYLLSEHATAIVGLQDEPWPQCVLYNRHNLPALPFRITVVVIQGDDSKDEEGTSLWVYVIAAVVVLAVVGVVAWLVVRYMRQRRASAEEAAGGSRNVDERRTGLLSDAE